MTDDHLRQRLPNRRYRRLIPAAVAAATLAASAPFAAAATAHAETRTPPRAEIGQPPGKIPTPLRVSTIPSERTQPNSAK